MNAYFASFEPKDWVTLALAIWGAALSSYLGYRQLGRDRKQLQIVLDRLEPDGDGRITISNPGHRPITVVDIDFRVQTRDAEGEWSGGHTRHEVLGQINTDVGEDRLPKLLNPSGRLAIHFPKDVFNLIKDPAYKTFVIIMDGDANVYDKYKLGKNWPKKTFKLPRLVWR